jgi:hypothetical protein
VSAQYQQQELGGISLADQAVAWLEFAKMHRREQIGDCPITENGKSRLEQNAGRLFSPGTALRRVLRQVSRRVRVVRYACEGVREPF